MNRLSQVLMVAVALADILLMGGCSSGGGSAPAPPAQISVVLSGQTASSLTAGTTTSLSALVSNDSSNAGVTWSASCGSAQCGSFNPVTAASGAQTTYTAPSAVPTPNTVTLTATSVTDKTKSASATVIVTAANLPISVALTTPAPSTLIAATNATLVAAVSNDSKNAGVTWSVSCGSAQCGSFNPTSTASGAATTYTAPTTVPSPNTVTVKATSVTDPTKSVSAAITIAPSSSAILPDGTYTFHLSGQDATGNYFVAGAFTVQGGAITGGEQDFVDPANGFSDAIVASGSSLSATTGNIQVVLATANTSVGVNGIETLRGTIVSNSHVAISQFDTFAAASGAIDVQSGNAALAGGYAFMLNGLDDSTPQNPLAIGGVLNVSGTSLVPGKSVFDYNDGGTVGQAQTFASGSVSAPDTYGRITINLSPSASTQVPGFVLTGYLAGNKVLLVENQPDALNGVLGGVALSQGAATGNFNQASVATTSYAYGVTGEDSYGLVNIAGGFGFNADGTVGGKLTLNDITYHTGNTIAGGTYTVDPTGRVTLSGVLAQTLNTTFTFQVYLDGSGNGLVIGADTLQATGGLAYQQTASSSEFAGSYALSGQGFLNAAGAPPWAAVGPVTVSSDTFSGFTDYTVQGAAPFPGVTLSGSEDSSTGVLTLNGLNADSFSAPTSYGYYPIDDSRVLAIAVGNDQLGLILLEGVSQAATH